MKSKDNKNQPNKNRISKNEPNVQDNPDDKRVPTVTPANDSGRAGPVKKKTSSPEPEN